MEKHQNNYSSTVSAPGSSIGGTSTPITTLPIVDAPFYLVFDADNANGNYEVIYCLTKGAGNVTHSALAKNHLTGESVKMMIVAEELNDWQTDISSISTLVQNSHPTGSIIFKATATLPTGFLFCDGSAISRTTYANLFSVIGTTYGAGDGSTTFLLPSLLSRSIVGYDSGDVNYNTLGKNGGAKTINVSHTHTMTSHSHYQGYGEASAGSPTIVGDGSPADTWVPWYGHVHSITSASISASSDNGTSSAGSSAQSILNKYVTLYPIIKT